jgi:GcrA cell cycle regulator
MTFWTDQRISELGVRWNNGESCAAICLALGATSRSAVAGKAHRLGLFKTTAHANSARRSNGSAPRARRRTGRRLLAVHTGNNIVEAGFKNAKPLLELRKYDCRWPGAGHGAGLLFCAAPTVEGHPYCVAHCRIAYLTPGQRSKSPRKGAAS